MRTSTLKSIAALTLTGAGSALVLGFQTTDEIGIASGAPAVTNVAVGSTSSSSSTSGSPATASPGSTPGSSAGSGGTPTTAATYADGTWTGAAVSEPWGDFQVQVVIAAGKITKVSVVEAPSDRHSTSINRQAVPLLTESVLASQGITVDMVSGATWTSDSYATSLQAALDKAHAAA